MHSITFAVSLSRSILSLLVRLTLLLLLLLLLLWDFLSAALPAVANGWFWCEARAVADLTTPVEDFSSRPDTKCFRPVNLASPSSYFFVLTVATSNTSSVILGFRNFGLEVIVANRWPASADDSRKLSEGAVDASPLPSCFPPSSLSLSLSSTTVHLDCTASVVSAACDIVATCSSFFAHEDTGIASSASLSLLYSKYCIAVPLNDTVCIEHTLKCENVAKNQNRL